MGEEAKGNTTSSQSLRLLDNLCVNFWVELSLDSRQYKELLLCLRAQIALYSFFPFFFFNKMLLERRKKITK